MAEDPNAEEDPFEGVYPDLEVAGRLIAAASGESEAEIDELRDSTDAGGWNVAWTLALLVRGVRSGEPAAVDLVDFVMSGEEPPAEG